MRVAQKKKSHTVSLSVASAQNKPFARSLARTTRELKIFFWKNNFATLLKNRRKSEKTRPPIVAINSLKSLCVCVSVSQLVSICPGKRATQTKSSQTKLKKKKISKVHTHHVQYRSSVCENETKPKKKKKTGGCAEPNTVLCVRQPGNCLKKQYTSSASLNFNLNLNEGRYLSKCQFGF